MRVEVASRNAFPKVEGALRKAEKAGLRASARVLQRAVKRKLRGGYTSGDFTTGRVLNSVRIGPVEDDGRGGLAVAVYSDLTQDGEAGDPNYPLYWEFGHFNIFTRRFEHEPRWGPAFHESQEEQVDAFIAAFQRAMGGAGESGGEG
jgi:hypothetical protein